MKSKLDAVRRGILDRPGRYLIYGDAGVGKSTLAADAPAPIFLDINRGTDVIDCARYTFDQEPDFQAVIAAIRDICENGADEFHTVVLDTANDMERLIWDAVIADAGRRSKTPPSSILEVGGGYHKGYSAAMDYHRTLACEFERCRNVGQNVILIAHSDLVKRKNPEGLDWQQYAPMLATSTEGNACEFWIGWCEAVLYVAYEQGSLVKEGTQGKTAKGQGWSSGRRLMHSQPKAHFRAKSRLPMESPVELPTDHPWALIHEAHQALVNPLSAWSRDQLIAACRHELARINDATLAQTFEHSLDTLNDNQLITSVTNLRKR